MTKLTNLEKIKAAWAMGWAARINCDNKQVHFAKPGVVVSIFENERVCLRSDDGSTFSLSPKMEGFEIKGYLYAGQLAGNEPIPEGQRFRLKGIFNHDYYETIKPKDHFDHDNQIWVKALSNSSYEGSMCKHYFEPVFD